MRVALDQLLQLLVAVESFNSYFEQSKVGLSIKKCTWLTTIGLLLLDTMFEVASMETQAQTFEQRPILSHSMA